MEELVKKWKEYKIERAEFAFTAGGDSMGDTELMFYDDKDAEVAVDDTFHDEMTDSIYANVDFYENSDGHYQGEVGVVTVRIEDPEYMTDDKGNTIQLEEHFAFEKDARSEYSNSYSDNVIVQMTQEEIDYIEEYIDGFDNDEVDDISFSYKKDFFMSEELEAIEKSVIDKIYDAYHDHEFEHTDEHGDTDDWFTISDLDVDSENKVSFNLNYQVTEYEDSDQ